MSSLNKPLSKQFKEEYEIIEKGLATKEEISRLKTHSNHKEWLAKWWIPINWCCDMVRVQCSKEGREIVKEIIKFKIQLESIIQYVQIPLPAICTQAVYGTCFFFLVHGAFAAQPCNAYDFGPWKIVNLITVIYSTNLFNCFRLLYTYLVRLSQYIIVLYI